MTTSGKIKRAQDLLSDVNERIDSAREYVKKMEIAAVREEEANRHYLQTLADELNSDPTFYYTDEDIDAILLENSDDMESRLYDEYLGPIERTKEAIETLETDRDIYTFYIQNRERIKDNGQKEF